MFDVVIVGGGPAGLAAAIYLARQKLSFVLLTGSVGGQTLLSSDVENYLGFHLLNGVELVSKFREHLDAYRDAFALKEGEEVMRIEKMHGGFRVKSYKEDYETKTVLIATGTRHRALDVPGEKQLYGHGVTYCATCDAPLFRGKSVFVIGGGNSAMDAALFLSKYAGSITLVTTNAELKGDSVMREKIRSDSRIRVLPSTKTTGILGKDRVVGISVIGPDKKERTENAEGVFIEVGVEPSVAFIDFVRKDRSCQIVVDKANATNVEGIWAAGDVTDVAGKQIAIAVGEGAKAALSIIRYLQIHP